MRKTPTTLRNAVACAVASLALVACAPKDLVRGLIQLQLDRFWTDPAKKAEAEAQAEAKLKASLDAALGGKEFEITGPNPYLHHIKWVDVDLGEAGPRISLPGAFTDTPTATNHVLQFDWEATWAKGNRAKLDAGLDLRSHSFFLAYEFPDHDLHVRDLSAWAKGTALVVLPKAGGPSTASLAVTAATIDLSASAEGWFWTVDIGNQVKKQVNDKVVRELIGKAIKLAFNASL